MSQKTRKKEKSMEKIRKYAEYNLKGNVGTKMRKKLVLNNIERTLGHVGGACRKAGISQRTHERWRKSDKEYNEAFEDKIEEVKDEVESLLIKQAFEGNLKAIIFFLKTKCKDRGYGTENYSKQKPQKFPIQNPPGIKVILKPDPKYEEERKK